MVIRRVIIRLMRFYDLLHSRRPHISDLSKTVFIRKWAAKMLISAAVVGSLFVDGEEAYGQRQRNDRVQQRRDSIIQSNRERDQRARDAKIAKENAIPIPKPAVMNVDVQAVISKEDLPSFAEAKQNSAALIEDGNELWLYVRFNGNLGNYAYAVREPALGGPIRYMMFADFGPQNDTTVQARFLLEFGPNDLAKSELKINLAPGRPGKNASTPVLLFVAGKRDPGLWKNELRLSNNPELNGPREKNLAVVPVTLDLKDGSAGYRAMLENYESIILRGTTDEAQLPIPGSFYDLPLKNRVLSILRGQGIVPARFFFSGDNWLESITYETASARSRHIFAAFTYRRGNGCFYGFAKIEEIFDFASNKFREAVILPQIGFPMSCKLM